MTLLLVGAAGHGHHDRTALGAIAPRLASTATDTPLSVPCFDSAYIAEPSCVVAPLGRLFRPLPWIGSAQSLGSLPIGLMPAIQNRGRAQRQKRRGTRVGADADFLQQSRTSLVFNRRQGDEHGTRQTSADQPWSGTFVAALLRLTGLAQRDAILRHRCESGRRPPCVIARSPER